MLYLLVDRSPFGLVASVGCFAAGIAIIGLCTLCWFLIGLTPPGPERTKDTREVLYLFYVGIANIVLAPIGVISCIVWCSRIVIKSYRWARGVVRDQ